MKKVKKLTSVFLALVMMLCMCVTAFADETSSQYSITVSNTNTSISIAGKTFRAYKLFDVTYDGDNYSYTIADAFKDFSYQASAEAKAVSGQELIDYVATLAADSEALNTFAEAALKYATDHSIGAAKTATVAESSESATIGLDDPGYYLVAGTATAPENQEITAACSLTTASPKAEVNVKADAPSVDKSIVKTSTDENGNSVNQSVKSDNSAIGDTVKYQVTSKVPDMTGYEKYYFVLNDTMSAGLTFKNDVVIKVGTTTLAKDTDYTVSSSVNESGVTSIEIIFKNFIQYKEQKGADITVSYSATVNEHAVIGTTGNDNSVKLTYSNNPNTTDNGDPENPDKPGPDSPKGTTPESKTRTYVTELKLIKTDEDGNQLNGAEFDITGEALTNTVITEEVFKEDENGTYYKLKNGSYTTTAPTIAEDETDNSDQYDGTTQKYKLTKETRTITAGENVTYHVVVNGEATITGLAAGTYTIKETKAPAGYNLLGAAKEVTIEWNEPAKDSTECTWTYTGTDKENDVCINQLTIVNESGAKLPSTGGIGTTLFYVIGGILVLGAAILLVTKKRMNSK